MSNKRNQTLSSLVVVVDCVSAVAPQFVEQQTCTLNQ